MAKKPASKGAETPTTPAELAEMLWKSADILRGSMESGGYRDFMLGLIFLKYIGDTFEAAREKVKRKLVEDEHLEGEILAEEMEVPYRYHSEHAFYVPVGARWSDLVRQAKGDRVGELVDDAMDRIMEENPQLRGALEPMYASEKVEQRTLAQVIDLLSNANFAAVRDGEHSSSKDVLGFVYEYFLGKFARAQGQKGGEFYTPTTVVNTLVGMIQPMSGCVYDPCCGSGGMFVQSNNFVHRAGGVFESRSKGEQRVLAYGQERNQATWRLARLNLAIHGIDGSVGDRWRDTFAEDSHPGKFFDYVLTNPPFNIKEWHRVEDDPRWVFGTPPKNNANFAWLQHVWSKLDVKGSAAVVMANGSLTADTGGQGGIRRAMVEGDAVAAVLVLPPNMFTTTSSPACVWLLSKDKFAGVNGSVDRSGQILFMDARSMGHMVSRTERVFSEEDIAKIANTWCAWRGMPSMYHADGSLVKAGEEPTAGVYEDEAGFCFSASLADVRGQDYVLTPGRYVGSAVSEVESAQELDARIADLREQLLEQFAESERLGAVVREQLASLDLEGGEDDE